MLLNLLSERIMEKSYLTTSQVRERKGVSWDSVFAAGKSGVLEMIRKGKLYFFLEEDVRKWQPKKLPKKW